MEIIKLTSLCLILNTLTIFAQFNFSPFSGNPVIPKGVGIEWDKSELWWPNITFVGDTLYLTYIGTNDFPSSSLSIGLATSTDGLHFTKHPNPILQANRSNIESFSVANGPLLKKDSVWYLYYNGISQDMSDPGRVIARATASVPYGPWIRENDTLLSVGQNGEWDDVEYYEAAKKMGITAFVLKENLTDIPALIRDIV